MTHSLFGVMNADVSRVLGEPSFQVIFLHTRAVHQRSMQWHHEHSRTSLDQKALLAQEQLMHSQDVYKTPEDFFNAYI